jgi:hypothetical protein
LQLRSSAYWPAPRYAAAIQDGIPREVAPNIWQGSLIGWSVRIGQDNYGWHVGIGHGTKRYTRLVLQARSFREAAAKARLWIENFGAEEL